MFYGAGFKLEGLQGHLAHKKQRPSLGIVPLQGPGGALFLMSELLPWGLNRGSEERKRVRQCRGARGHPRPDPYRCCSCRCKQLSKPGAFCTGLRTRPDGVSTGEKDDQSTARAAAREDTRGPIRTVAAPEAGARESTLFFSRREIFFAEGKHWRGE